MAIINVKDLFPEGKDGKREPLPKQAEFIKNVLDPNGPKYVAYISGIGGGKTLVGCITMFLMGIKYAGDYVIGRQHLTELKTTTYKTFKDICPEELILEDNRSESFLKIRAQGGTSTFYFRGLEEYDKLKSMNLSGFMIDECDQVAEDAFLMLQGRLRGSGLRKGILVSNPAGHNWTYRWFFKKDFIRNDKVKNMFYLIRGSSLENKHLAVDYIENMLETWSKDRIEREIMGSFDAFEGAVYDEFRRDVHVIKPFRIPEEWPRFIGIDHGFRNPSAWIWVAIGPDGEAYIYNEFYRAGWLINEIVGGKKGDTGYVVEEGVIHAVRRDKMPDQAFIDPSTKNRRGTTGESDWDEYRRVLPSHFPLYPAQNDVRVGIDRVKSYLKVNPKTKKPNLYIFESCNNLIEEITQYRWDELKPSQHDNKAENERPKKVNDHACDALRYVIVTLPEPYVADKDPSKNLAYNSLEFRLAKTLGELTTRQQKDPFT